MILSSVQIISDFSTSVLDMNLVMDWLGIMMSVAPGAKSLAAKTCTVLVGIVIEQVEMGAGHNDFMGCVGFL